MNVKQYFRNLFSRNPKVKKTFGIILMTIGIIALVTPATPGSWLIFVGLGLLGIEVPWWRRFILRLKGVWRKIRRK